MDGRKLIFCMVLVFSLGIGGDRSVRAQNSQNYNSGLKNVEILLIINLNIQITICVCDCSQIIQNLITDQLYTDPI